MGPPAAPPPRHLPVHLPVPPAMHRADHRPSPVTLLLLAVWGACAVLLCVLMAVLPGPAQARGTDSLDGSDAAAAPSPARATLEAAAAPVSADTRALAQAVLARGDHGGRPFAIVDKRHALLAVFDGRGRLAGATPALLGSAAGDASLPGVGERTQAGTLRPQDKTTPAGRFASAPGRNHTGEAVVWVEPATAFAIHRVRPDTAAPERLRRLAAAAASAQPGAAAAAQQRRVTAGCVVVAPGFFDGVVAPLLGRTAGVVYVLPEHGAAGTDARVAALLPGR